MVPVITDPMAVPVYRDTRLNRFIEGLLYDKRDVVFFWLTVKVVAVLVPFIALMFWHFSWWLAPLFWAVQLGLFGPPVILMLHCVMHRPFFKRHPVLTRTHPYLMSALFGIPTGYMEHHVAMHHVENNLPDDLSSTMRFQRDSFLHFVSYFTRFFFLSIYELPAYLSRKKRRGLTAPAIVSTLAQWGLLAGLTALDWRAGLVCFIAPWFTVHFMMMMGNWGQHAFIDARQPGNSYVNSITCINSGYNKRCFNDGYHIGHHVKSNRHWAELPKDFADNVDRYAKEGCVVYVGLDFFIVSVLLFLKRYDVLARRFVRLPGDTRTDEQVIAFLKERTRQIAVETAQPATA